MTGYVQDPISVLRLLSESSVFYAQVFEKRCSGIDRTVVGHLSAVALLGFVPLTFSASVITLVTGWRLSSDGVLHKLHNHGFVMLLWLVSLKLWSSFELYRSAVFRLLATIGFKRQLYGAIESPWDFHDHFLFVTVDEYSPEITEWIPLSIAWAVIDRDLTKVLHIGSHTIASNAARNQKKGPRKQADASQPKSSDTQASNASGMVPAFVYERMEFSVKHTNCIKHITT